MKISAALRLAVLGAIVGLSDAWFLRKRQGTRVARRHEALLFARGSAHQKTLSGAKLVEAMRVVHKTAYWGQMTLGTPPQPFKVIFDTGSGNLIVPAADCTVPGCAPHKKYNSKASTSSSFVTNEKGESSSEITFGTGQVSGGFVKDSLCMGSSLCFDANFIAADKMTTEPFQEIPFDGIMGLGFKDLSMGNGFNIVDDLSGRADQFSFYVTDGEDSEVTFGGYRPELLASDIVWAPVKVQSWWQVAIDDITFNNQPKSLCDGECQVAVDTGTSMLAGPSDLVDKLTSMVNAKEDCSNFNELPNIGFQLGNTVLNLQPDDYMDRDGGSCSFSMMALDVPPPKGPVFIFGDPFLRRFVTIYDRTKPAVGFAVAKRNGETATSGLIAQISGDSSSVSRTPASASSPSAVDLHLDAGSMTGAAGADESEETPAPEAVKQETADTPTPEAAEWKPDNMEAPKEEPKPLSASTDIESLEKAEADSNPFTSSPASSGDQATATQTSAAVGKSSSSSSSEADAESDMRKMLGLRSFIQKPRQHQHGLVSVRLHREK